MSDSSPQKAMSPPAPSAILPAPFATPTRRKFPAPDAPGAAIMACTADPDSCEKIMIHTAKCSICDQRNAGTMLRCPGCMWQICEDCVKKREARGVGLEHGNMGTPGRVGPPIMRTPRRGLFNPSGTPTPPTVEQEAEGGRDASTSPPMPTPKAPSSSTKRARPKPKLKGKAKKVEFSDDEEDFDRDLTNDGDGDFAAPGIPTPSKRQKVATGESPSPGRRPTRGSGSAGAKAGPRSSLSPNGAINTTINSQLFTASTSGIARSSDLADLVNNHVGGTGYKEHFLSRSIPPTNNSVFMMPNNITASFGKLPTAEEMQRRIARRVRFKLWGAEGAAGEGLHETTSGSEAEAQKTEGGPSKAANEPELKTVRDFAIAEYTKRVDGTALDDDQRSSLKSIMVEAARKTGTQMYNLLAAALRCNMQSGLAMEMQFVGGSQMIHLVKAVNDAAESALKDFEEEAAGSFPTVPTYPTSRSQTRSPQSMSPGSNAATVGRAESAGEHHDSGVSVRSGATDTLGSDAAGAGDTRHYRL